MYCLTLFLLIAGGILPLTSSSFVTYDCLDLKKREFLTEIWSSTFPDNAQSLTVQNCENLVINISIMEGIKSNLQYLTVRNVKTCKITGNGCCGTSLPSHTNFTDVKNMEVEVPLYGEGKSIEGVLQFTNVTIKRLKPGTVVTAASSLKKFSMRRVTVIIAERDAVIFDGSIDSLLEIEDSTFYSVDENFINCKVTSAIMLSNRFLFMKEDSFSLETTTFNSLGNVAVMVENCAVRLHFSQKQKLNSGCSCTKNSSFNGKICVGLTVEDTEERTTSHLRESYFGKILNRTALEKEAVNYKNSDEYTTHTDKTRRDEVSVFALRFGNRFLLLWFLAISLLVLMFPVAYFTKIFLCRIIDKAVPLDMKHKLLVNTADI